jgi:nitroreductase
MADEREPVDALHAIATRRSVRRFTDAPLTEEQLETVLRAAMAAPSASNGRSWRFVVVRDRDTLQRLAHATPFASPVAEAAACIVVCADRPTLKYPGFWVIDCSAAIENLLLAAHATGLGAVWIGVHPIAPFRYAVRRVIQAPATVVVHSMIAIGTPAAAHAPVDRYEGSFIHLERW